MYVKNTCIELYDIKEHNYKNVNNRYNIICIVMINMKIIPERIFFFFVTV